MRHFPFEIFNAWIKEKDLVYISLTSIFLLSHSRVDLNIEQFCNIERKNVYFKRKGGTFSCETKCMN